MKGIDMLIGQVHQIINNSPYIRITKKIKSPFKKDCFFASPCAKHLTIDTRASLEEGVAPSASRERRATALCVFVPSHTALDSTDTCRGCRRLR